MTATLITGIIASVRAAGKKVSKGLSAFGKGVSELGKKVYPVLAPLFSLVGNIIALGAKGVSWLAKNLWVLALFVTYVIYDYYEPMNTIEPTFQSKEFVCFMGKRKLTNNSITGVFKHGMNYNFPFPKTFAQEVVLPESIVLRFKFKSANNKSWFKKNLARLLLDDLEVKIGDVVVYNLADTSKVGIYQDLWLSEEEREDMVEKGLGSEDFRKLCSGFEPALSDATAVRLFNTTPYLCAKLDRVFEGNASLYPSGLGNILNVILFPDASKIMVAASGSKAEGYSIEDVRLEFESFSSEGTRKEDMGKGSRNLAIEASNEYSGGKQMVFDAPFFV